MQQSREAKNEGKWATLSETSNGIVKRRNADNELSQFFKAKMKEITELKAKDLKDAAHASSLIKNAYLADNQSKGVSDILDAILKSWDKNKELDSIFDLCIRKADSRSLGSMMFGLRGNQKWLMKFAPMLKTISDKGEIECMQTWPEIFTKEGRRENMLTALITLRQLPEYLAEFIEECEKPIMQKYGKSFQSAFERIATEGDAKYIANTVITLKALPEHLKIFAEECVKPTRIREYGTRESAFEYMAREGDASFVTSLITQLKGSSKYLDALVEEYTKKTRIREDGTRESTFEYIARETPDSKIKYTAYALCALRQNVKHLKAFAAECAKKTRTRKDGTRESAFECMARECVGIDLSYLMVALKRDDEYLGKIMECFSKPVRTNSKGQKCSAIDYLAEQGENDAVSSALNALQSYAAANVGLPINKAIMERGASIIKENAGEKKTPFIILEAISGIQSINGAQDKYGIKDLLLSQDVSKLIEDGWRRFSNNPNSTPYSLKSILDEAKNARSAEDVSRAKELARISESRSSIGIISARQSKKEVANKDILDLIKLRQSQLGLKAHLNRHMEQIERTGKLPTQAELCSYVISSDIYEIESRMQNMLASVSNEQSANRVTSKGRRAKAKKAKIAISQQNGEARESAEESGKSSESGSSESIVGDVKNAVDIKNIEQLEARREERAAKAESKRIKEISRKLERVKAEKARGEGDKDEKDREGGKFAKLESLRAAKDYCQCTIL